MIYSLEETVDYYCDPIKVILYKQLALHSKVFIFISSLAQNKFGSFRNKKAQHKTVGLIACRGGGIRTPGTSRYNGFQDHRIRPLCHASVSLQFLCSLCYSDPLLQRWVHRIRRVRLGHSATHL